MTAPVNAPAPVRSRKAWTRSAILLTAVVPLVAAAAVAPSAVASTHHTTSRQSHSVTKPASRTYRPNTSANRQNESNPLAGRSWATYKGDADPAWKPYEDSRGAKHRSLAYIANMPKAKWFGRWLSVNQIGEKVQEYIANATATDPNALVQMTMFDMDPWERQACETLPSAYDKSQYKHWITNAARAIGDTHVALILQPDGPFALCAPNHSRVYSNLIGWAAKTFSALPNTSVYVDMGSSDWMRGNVQKAVQILLRANVAAARGFSMDITHFSSTEREIVFGTRVVRALARHGVPNRHFVIDTADNGKGFSGRWWHAHHSATANFNNAAPCASKSSSHCVTLGIPPTTDVANPKWGMSAKARREAANHVDGFLWISRPWLSANDELFHMSRALQEIATTPF